MPINYDEILSTIDTMAQRLQVLKNVVNHHKRPYIRVNDVTIALTEEQKQNIIQMYASIKAELAALYQQLPDV